MKRQMISLALLCLLTSPAWAVKCSITIGANDMMQYSISKIVVPKRCEVLTVKLDNTGKLPRNVMGHDWVLSRPADEQGILAAGASAGLSHGYLKRGDPRVIAHTKLIGGGKSDSVTFRTNKLKEGKPYTYFCSFPGHAVIMYGTLIVK